MPLQPYDLIVLGGGPAGVSGAITAGMLGRRVALIEKTAEIGGAGINTGTVPSKTLRETALALSGLRSRRLHGVDLSLRREATVADFTRHQGQVKVFEGETPVLALCVQSVEPIPDADAVIMHKLMIEGDEQTYLRVANRFEPTLYGFIAIRPRMRT